MVVEVVTVAVDDCDCTKESAHDVDVDENVVVLAH